MLSFQDQVYIRKHDTDLFAVYFDSAILDEAFLEHDNTPLVYSIHEMVW